MCNIIFGITELLTACNSSTARLCPGFVAVSGVNHCTMSGTGKEKGAKVKLERFRSVETGIRASLDFQYV